MTRTGRSFLLLVCLFVVACLPPVAASHAAGPPLTLPADYADFELNPANGDLAAVAAESGEAVLFRADALQAGKTEPAAKVRVGSVPCSVFYKQFGDTQAFAVVCSQDSHLYLINAADFQLLEKIPLDGSGVSLVTGSINPADPFLYYCYGSGHGSMAGAVSLRDMQNHGAVFDHSMDCAFSASGQIAYRRGPWSPSGFESLQLTNRLTDTKPTFGRLFYDHNSTAAYLPDPFDRFTAAGNRIFTRSLEKNEATLDFVPLAFFRQKPVVVGIEGETARRPSLRRETARDGGRDVVLRAASYNTFSSIGERVTLSPAAPADEGALPRGVPSQADFKRVAKRARLFADDGRARVVYASRKEVHFVPVAEFKLPDEPFLQATLEGGQPLAVGAERTMKIKPLDPRVQVAFDPLPTGLRPEGMTVDGTSLTWTPTREQVGPAKIAVTLKHADIQRSQTFELSVVYPSIELPFAPADWSLAPDAKAAVLWEGPATDGLGRPQAPAAANGFRLALIDLASGKVLAERKQAELVQRVACTDSHVLVFGSEQPPRCEILRRTDLHREQTLNIGAPVQSVDVCGKALAIRTQVGLELYDLTTFKRFRPFGAVAGAAPDEASGVSERGLLVRGVLLDADLKPALLMAPAALPAPAGAESPWRGGMMRPAAPTMGTGGYPAWGPTGQGQTRLAFARLPDRNLTVSLDQRLLPIQVPGSIHTQRSRLELLLTASGETDGQQVLLREDRSGAVPQEPARGKLRLTPREALVLYGGRLYRWPLPQADGRAPTPPRLAFVPRQSALTLAGTGKTVLTHETRGGKPPLGFSLRMPSDATTLDEKTGAVTIDEAKLLDEAARTLERWSVQNARGAPYVDALRAQAIAVAGYATELIGRKPKGFPVAMPIRLDVRDADGASDTLHYFVLAEVPTATILERLQPLDENRSKPMAAAAERRAERAPAGRTAPPAAGPEGNELDDLRRRVESLEARLDLLTRQLNELLKQRDRR